MVQLIGKISDWLFSKSMDNYCGYCITQPWYLYKWCKIRPFVEYACQVWHGRLTLAESTYLETIQRRTLRIIYRDEVGYTALLIKADLPKLSERRKKSVISFSTKFKNYIPNSTTCYLLNGSIPCQLGMQNNMKLLNVGLIDTKIVSSYTAYTISSSHQNIVFH